MQVVEYLSSQKKLEGGGHLASQTHTAKAVLLLLLHIHVVCGLRQGDVRGGGLFRVRGVDRRVNFESSINGLNDPCTSHTVYRHRASTGMCMWRLGGDRHNEQGNAG